MTDARETQTRDHWHLQRVRYNGAVERMMTEVRYATEQEATEAAEEIDERLAKGRGSVGKHVAVRCREVDCRSPYEDIARKESSWG